MWVILPLLISFTEITVGAGTKDIPFKIEWNKFEPNVIDFPSITHDAPAGKHGHVVARSDQLYFSDGRRARFWGVGLTFSENKGFPPDKATADGLARRIARLGFNHVRLVGLDHSGKKPLVTWLQTGKLKHEDLDRLGYFISRLKLEGIYYSFSINNNSIALLDPILSEVGNTSARTRLWRYKNVRLYNIKAIDQIVSWFKAFYSWENPYTGLTFAEDPANIYLSAVNEDSIFSGYFRKFKLLDEKSLRLLEDKFEEFLIGNYGSWSAVESAWNGGSQSMMCINSHQDKGRILLGSIDKKKCHQQLTDVMHFLVKIDQEFYVQVREALRAIGYKGLFTGTNNWFGYGNLYANAVAGDYIETHGYFDHPKRTGPPARSEGIIGHSYVSREGQGMQSIEKEHSYPLSKAFRSALVSRPLVISEWGHSGWGQFSYEGLALLASYASFQGYPVMSAHTFFNHPNPNPKDTVSRRAMAVGGNPVLVSLMPSFSLAFLRGDIASPQSSYVISCAKTLNLFFAIIDENGLKREDGICGVHDWLGYTRKIRTQLIGDFSKKSLPLVAPSEVYKSETGEIIWGGINNDNDFFAVNSPRFNLATTPRAGLVTFGDSYDIDFESHGIVTMVSLDDKPISEVSRVLVTIAQSFHNTNIKTFSMGGKFWVRDAGESPSIMTIPMVSISMNVDPLTIDPIAVCGLSPNGDISDLGDATLIPKDDGTLRLTMKLGRESGPWYVLSKRSPISCTKKYFETRA